MIFTSVRVIFAIALNLRTAIPKGALVAEKCHHTPDSRRVGFPPFLLSGAPGLKYGSILEFGPMQDIAVWLKTEMSGGRPKGVLSSALALPSG